MWGRRAILISSSALGKVFEGRVSRMMRRVAQDGNDCRRQSRWLLLPAFVLSVLACGAVRGQTAPNTIPMPLAPATASPPLPKLSDSATRSEAPSDAAPTTIKPTVLPRMPEVRGASLDRVVATVNGDLILDSDIDQEQRFANLLPYGEAAAGAYSRGVALERLINRALILQQTQLQPSEGITLAAAAKDLDSLRKTIPACKEYHCETKTGWDRFLMSQGFTEQSLTSLWRERMEVLAFIELRFRMGVRISPAEIQTYYEKTMLPQYAAKGAKAPPVEAISSRIQEVLLQQQVSSLLRDWLNSLRAQGSVVVFHPGEQVP